MVAKSGNGKMPKAKSKSAPATSTEDDKWRARDDMRMLSQAREIEDDPQRMGAAADCAKEEMGRLARVAPIKVEVAKRTIPAVKST